MSTTITPAPVTPPPRLGATPYVEEPETAQPESRWATGLRWAGDATSIILLIAVLWWLSYHDGGVGGTSLARVGLLALAAVPSAVAELRRIPTSVRILVGSWAIGLIASLAFAAERSGFAFDTITYSLIPLVGLAVHRIWRQRWGPPALASLLMVSFGLYWREAFLSWWGLSLMEGRQPEWRVLSWHNQSGTLMVAFGLLFGGLAMAGRRLIAMLFGLAAAAAFAGAWLAGSRGAVVVLVLGGLVLFVATVRARGWVPALRRSVVLVIASFAIASGLLWFAGSQSGTEVARVVSASGDPAEHNFLRRFLHMDAALGMFADSPLTGQGVGSYRNMALPFTSPESNLTSSAHNEYAEVLGEGGLALALPFLGLTAFALFACRRRFTRAGRGLKELADEIEVGDLRWPLSLGATAMTAALLVHQGADFDWGYPVIPALLAIGVVVAGHDARKTREDRQTTGLFAATAIAVAFGALLATGSVALLWQARSLEQQAGMSAAEAARVPVAWDVDRASQAAFQLMRSGEYELARWTLERTIAWNPGYHPARVDLAIVDYTAGDISGQQLVDVLFDGFPDFASANEVSAALIDGGDYALAESVLVPYLDIYPNYESWGIGGARAYTWHLLVRSAAESDGCAAARKQAAQARTADGMDDPQHLEPIDQLVEETCR